MKIVILDGYSLEPKKSVWEKFKNLGDIAVYEYSPTKEQVIERAKDAKAVLLHLANLNRETLSELIRLKYIGIMATGYNMVDVEKAARMGIRVTNLPNYCTNSVAQMTVALILELTNKVQKLSDRVINGGWTHDLNSLFREFPLIELDKKILGIIGFGRIGQKTAKMLSAFGMKVLAYDIKRASIYEEIEFEWSELDDLLKRSDIVSVHCPITPENIGMINRNTLMKMKKSAFLINTSRGKLVIDEDLADALNNNIIAGAALDVISKEPPQIDNPLFKSKNIIITPHMAGATIEANERIIDMAYDNLYSFMKGEAKNIVV